MQENTMHPLSAAPVPTIADITEHLFEVYRHPTGRKFSNREVETEIPGSIKYTNNYKIRVGQIPNPGRESVLIFCRFFNISPVYFFPELWDKHVLTAFQRCLTAGNDPDCPHIRFRQVQREDQE